MTLYESNNTLMRIFLHEKNLSAQSDQEIQDPRLFDAHGHQGRPQTDQPQAGKGPETIGGLRKPFIFPKKDRILKRYEFLEFYSLGKALHSPGFILVYKRGVYKPGVYNRGQAGGSRIGITVSKKVGHAVVRNRIKRRVREYYRLHRMAVPETWDFHVIAKKPASPLSFRQTVAMLAGLFDKFAKIAGAVPGTAPAMRNHLE